MMEDIGPNIRESSINKPVSYAARCPDSLRGDVQLQHNVGYLRHRMCQVDLVEPHHIVAVQGGGLG